MDLGLDEWDMRLDKSQVRSLDLSLDLSDDWCDRSIPYFGRSISCTGISWFDTLDVGWVGGDSFLSPVDQRVDVWLENSIVVSVCWVAEGLMERPGLRWVRETEWGEDVFRYSRLRFEWRANDGGKE
jgi:hypothetical protein